MTEATIAANAASVAATAVANAPEKLASAKEAADEAAANAAEAKAKADEKVAAAEANYAAVASEEAAADKAAQAAATAEADALKAAELAKSTAYIAGLQNVAPITDVSASIEGFVWFPADYGYMNSYFAVQDDDYSINILAISVAALFVLCLCCMFACVKFADKALTVLLPVVTGALGFIAYALSPALMLCATPVLASVIKFASLAMFVLGAVALYMNLSNYEKIKD